MWNIFKPLIRYNLVQLTCTTLRQSRDHVPFPYSHKFGRKLTYVNYLAELRGHLNYEQLIIPPDVLRF